MLAIIMPDNCFATSHSGSNSPPTHCPSLLYSRDKILFRFIVGSGPFNSFCAVDNIYSIGFYGSELLTFVVQIVTIGLFNSRRSIRPIDDSLILTSMFNLIRIVITAFRFQSFKQSDSCE